VRRNKEQRLMSESGQKRRLRACPYQVCFSAVTRHCASASACRICARTGP